MSGFYNESQIICQFFEVFLYESVLKPVLAYGTGLSISNELVRIERYFEVQVVVDHYLECLTCKAFALVLVDGLAVDTALRSVSVCIDSSIGGKFFHEFRSQFLVKLFGNVS